MTLSVVLRQPDRYESIDTYRPGVRVHPAPIERGVRPTKPFDPCRGRAAFSMSRASRTGARPFRIESILRRTLCGRQTFTRVSRTHPLYSPIPTSPIHSAHNTLDFPKHLQNHRFKPADHETTLTRLAQPEEAQPLESQCVGSSANEKSCGLVRALG